MDNLNCCPFCGAAVTAQLGHGNITYVTCDGCGAIISFLELINEPPNSPYKIQELFNRRTIPRKN